MSTTITGRRVLVTPAELGPALEGSPGSSGVGAWSVPLVADYLRQVGGEPYQVGNVWKLTLGLRYVDSNGDLQPIDLTSVSALALTMYRVGTGEVIGTRTQDTEIVSGLPELEVSGDATDGNVTVAFGPAETFTAGIHMFRLVGTWSSLPNGLAAGRLEIRAATPVDA